MNKNVIPGTSGNIVRHVIDRKQKYLLDYFILFS